MVPDDEILILVRSHDLITNGVSSTNVQQVSSLPHVIHWSMLEAVDWLLTTILVCGLLCDCVNHVITFRFSTSNSSRSFSTC